MKLFVNGDSHTAKVYPNGGVTATEQLARKFGWDYENIAVPGGSNQRIIRTTQERLLDLDPKDTLIIIGWSSFERTEYYYKNQWHQISGDFEYEVDPELDNVRRERIADYPEGRHFDKHAEQHNQIYVFHKLLEQQGFRHLFYQGCLTHFFDCEPEQEMAFKFDWNDCWVHDPYVKPDWTAESFSRYSLEHGCKYADHRMHYGQGAHDLWAKHLEPFVK